MSGPATSEPAPGPEPDPRPNGAGAPDESNRRERQGDEARPREGDRRDTAAEDASNRREREPYGNAGEDYGTPPRRRDPGPPGPGPRPPGNASKDDQTVPAWLKKIDSDL